MIQDIQIRRIYKTGLTTAAHRVGCERVQKVCLHTGDLKDPVKDLEVTVVSRVSPYQESEAFGMEAEESALEARRCRPR